VSRIVVGVDGSANSIAAVQWAAELAEGLGAEVIAIHALGLLDHLDPGRAPVSVERHRDEISERFRSVWCRPLDSRKVAFREELVYGPPVEALLRTAAEHDADLIVVGSRGVGEEPSALLGSTSAQVVHRSGRPVTVVPPPGRADS
jgi:nucleotide-binding universal stress UspA family protein